MQHLDPAVFRLMRAHPERVPVGVLDHVAEVYRIAVDSGLVGAPAAERDEDDVEDLEDAQADVSHLPLHDQIVVAKRRARQAKEAHSRAKRALDEANRWLTELQRKARPVEGAAANGPKVVTEATVPSAGVRPPHQWIQAQLPHLPTGAKLDDRRILLQVAYSRGIEVRWYSERCSQATIVLMRGEAAWRLRQELGRPYLYIGKLFGQDHTTVMNAARKFGSSIGVDHE